MILFKALTRVFATTGKETLVFVRRPSALATLVAGPIVILALFGIAFVGQAPIRAVLVIPPDAGLPGDVSAYGLDQPGVLQVVGTETSVAAGRNDLHMGKADIIVLAPPGAAKDLQAGKQVQLTIEYDTVNPYQDALIARIAQPLATKVNQKIVAQAINQAAQSGSTPPPNARLLAAPTTATTRDLAPTTPRLVSFYGVAVLALIIQHLGLTLGALSMTGDRRQGMLTVLRIAPVGALELLAGKYVAFVILAGAVTGLLLVLMTTVLGVPMLASFSSVLLLLALVILASIGMGLVLSLLTRSESQVIQLALLILIASVFFGGLAIDLSQFARPLQVAAELLPVSQATHLAQDLFLRGATSQAWRFTALAAMAGALAIAAWWLLRRELMLSR
jgi:ABC-2 type transport system permease protein